MTSLFLGTLLVLPNVWNVLEKGIEETPNVNIFELRGFDGLIEFVSQPLFVQARLVSASQVHNILILRC